MHPSSEYMLLGFMPCFMHCLEYVYYKYCLYSSKKPELFVNRIDKNCEEKSEVKCLTDSQDSVSFHKEQRPTRFIFCILSLLI